MKTRTRITVSVAAVTLAVASAFAAQGGAGPGPGAGPGTGPCLGAGPGMGYGPGMGMGYGPGLHGHGPGGWDAEAVGARLDALKAELRITAAQGNAWQAFAGLAQQHVEQRQALRTQLWTQMQDPQTAATLDRAAFHEAMRTLRQQQWDERQAALDGLYAVLTPKQKALAEQRLAGGPGYRGAMRGPGR